MTTPRRAILISDRYTYLCDGRILPTPAGSLTEGPAAWTALLDRVSRTFDGEGVLILDGAALAALGQPVTAAQMPTPGSEDAQRHPIVTAAREAGWGPRALWPWTTYTAPGRATVHVGMLPTIDPRRCPILCGDRADTVAALALWHRLTGVAYHGTPGVAGTSLIRATARHRPAGSKTAKEPFWLPPAPGLSPDEWPYKREHFSGDVMEGHDYIHSYDAARAYLAAASQVMLTPGKLTPTGPLEWSKDLAGWWLIRLEPWTHELLPHPAGYTEDREDGRPEWHTGPTLQYLSQLAGEGVYGGYEVVDSYTAPGATRLLRRFADILRDAANDDAAQPVPGRAAVGRAVQAALKEAYREGPGLCASPGGLIHRPDWWYAIVAHARVTIHRRVTAIYDTTGRWPYDLDTDDVRYTSPVRDPWTDYPGWSDPRTGKPGGIVRFDPAGPPVQLGTCKSKGTWEVAA